MLGARADVQDAQHRERIAAAFRTAAGVSSGWLLLETCHRVELYGFGSTPHIDGSLRLVTGDLAVRHAMRVAAGLDSAIVGEDEVLHQVRSALRGALATGSVDRRLQRLFETSIAAGRQARARRSGSSANLAQRAMSWLDKRSGVRGRTVLVIGAGHMGSALAHKAALLGARVTIASRDPTRAHRLARVFGADSTDLSGAAELVSTSAAIAVALGGPWRELRPSVDGLPPIADISAPPAIAQAIRNRLNGSYLSIDDLYLSQEPAPSGYIENANRIVEAKAREFLSWLENR